MDPNRPPRQKTSPWLYIGCGCGLLVALVLAGIVGLTVLGYKKGKDVEETFKDPVKRAAKTKEILHYDTLPEGYYPMGGFSVPMTMDMAMLTDHEPTPGEGGRGSSEFRDHGFVYTVFRSWLSKNRNELRDYMNGKGPRPKWMNRSDVDLEDREILKRGHVDANGQDILYVATRTNAEHHGRHKNGLVTFLAIECPNDNRQRFGLWLGPDPGPGQPTDTLELAGTNADPEAIKEFAGHFRFCDAQP
jgi:hypothetical protein